MQTISTEPTIRIMLPLAEEETAAQQSIDQTENVIINGVVTQIRRGELVEVKVPVFWQLKQRYPRL